MSARTGRSLFTRPARVEGETPAGAWARGAMAGLAATLLMSGLARVLPGMRAIPPFLRRPPGSSHDSDTGRIFAGSAGAALAQPTAPGPEGLAEQFAFKVASGVFGRDISPYLRPAGRAVHLAYGSAWGGLYGLLQASYPRVPAAAGAGYGIMVWLVGPATLVPAMKLMGRPAEEPPVRTTTLLVTHLAYGLAVAGSFEALHGGTT